MRSVLESDDDFRGALAKFLARPDIERYAAQRQLSIASFIATKVSVADEVPSSSV